MEWGNEKDDDRDRKSVAQRRERSKSKFVFNDTATTGIYTLNLHDTLPISAAVVVEETFDIGRHTGVTVEPRSIVADYQPGEGKLTVYQSTQAPHMMQNVFAKHLGMNEGDVRVVTKDVGGSFGIKVHVYADEFAAVALSKMFQRPVKFIADRLESFVTDIHARDHLVKARMGVSKIGSSAV